MLKIDKSKVYALSIERVQLSPRRTRWRLSDVRKFMSERTIAPAAKQEVIARVPANSAARGQSIANVLARRHLIAK